MSIRVPEFPLDCDVYTGPWLTKTFRATVSCNLVFGRRVNFGPQTPEVGQEDVWLGVMFALFPKLTDIRTPAQGIVDHDILEIPADSGRWYQVLFCDDVAKGFDNEHREAVLIHVTASLRPDEFPGANWPIPMP